MIKDKPEEMGRLTSDLVVYYQQLAESMKRLSEEYPAMPIDTVPMSEIEGEERKAIGEGLANDLAPLVGNSGVALEREALLVFFNALNEQRHLAGVMIGLETNPELKRFLQTTRSRLDARHMRVAGLLNRRYFTH